MLKIDNCVLTSSLLIIKQGKYRNLKDEVDEFDDISQSGLSSSDDETSNLHVVQFFNSQLLAHLDLRF